MRTRGLLALGAGLVAFGAASAAGAGSCRDPWVTNAVREVTRREPNGSGESGECNILNYGGGRWTTYADLVGKVRASLNGAPLRTLPAASQASFAAPPAPVAMNTVITPAQMARLSTKMINGQPAVLIDGKWYAMVAAGGGNMRVGALIGQDGGS